MTYRSTRGSNAGTGFSEAVRKGLADDGGLFVPEEKVTFDNEDLEAMVNMTYPQLAEFIFSKYATDFTAEELHTCVHNAYESGSFPNGQTGFTVLNDKMSVLELYHGPTCAFKDMALQILPEFMVTAGKKCGNDSEITILTATSGDTGKAALEGFRDVPGIKVMVFYPVDGVSEMQRYQMITQLGTNVMVSAIKGNFDNAQSGVKKIFSDKEFAEKIGANGKMLSSANSINWGRLLPQIVYYFHAYMELVRRKEIGLGTKINFSVPTGNFGDILACYYAKKAGLFVNKIICASNTNSVVADFLKTGTYNKNRDFHVTMSPAMDILVSSNLERLLYDCSGCDSAKVSSWMNELNTTGCYSVDAQTEAAICDDFWSAYSSEEETTKTISDVYAKYNYLIDPHTAVGVNVYQKYVETTGDIARTVCVSTASPFKFNKSVAEAIFGVPAIAGMDEFEVLNYLSEKTGIKVPAPLEGLNLRPIRFTGVCLPEEMKQKAEEFINV